MKLISHGGNRVLTAEVAVMQKICGIFSNEL